MMDDDEIRWRQVLARREPSQPFFYAVRTTKIFCKPTCPSRRPSRENVVFFDSATVARANGFRACLRCTPEATDSSDLDVQVIVAACRMMIDAGGPVPHSDLARATGLPIRSLTRAFERTIAVSPREFGSAIRTDKARGLLREHQEVTRAVFDAGFGSMRSFYETTAPKLGMTPNTYAKGGAGERLTWSSTSTPLGTLMAVASPQGLCAVRLGADQGALLTEVATEFPEAHLEADHEGLANITKAISLLATGHAAERTLPLEFRGTAFQARVWTALTRIPRGQTRSYREVAEDIGAPTSARAVATACAANGLALVVPCHRVIRSDGDLGGYRWGLALKRTLLEAERDMAAISDTATQDQHEPRDHSPQTAGH